MEQVFDNVAVLFELGKIGDEFLIQTAKHSNSSVHSNSSCSESNLTFSIFGPCCADVVADIGKVLEQTKYRERDLFVGGLELVRDCCLLTL